MALVEFSFTSRATRDLPPAARLRIAREAWHFNTRLGLTGELRFDRGCFRQVIEGPCDVVLSLASRILTDPRHADIGVLALRSIAARRFATWTAVGFGSPAALDCASVPNLRILPLYAQNHGVPAIEPARGSLIG